MIRKYLLIVIFVFISTFIGGCNKKIEKLENDTVSWLAMLPKDNPSMHEQKDIDIKWKIDYDESIMDVSERVEKWFLEWAKLGKDNIPEIASILERFFDKGDTRVDIAEVVLALGYVGDSNSLVVLTRALNSDDIRVRISATVSLGLIADTRAIKNLCKAAISDEDINVRANAVAALGRFSELEAKDCVLKATSDEDDFVASIAKETLREMENN